MEPIHGPFIGSEALAAGALNRYHLRRHHRAIMPNVYLDNRVEPTLYDRTVAAWLWSGRQAVVAGLAAAAIHGAKWVDDDTPVELIWRNGRSPTGVVTRDDLLLPDEYRRYDGLPVTTPERTAFDLGRRAKIGTAVARLDALAAATGFKVNDVEPIAAVHRHTRGLRQLERALDLMDPGAQSPKETWLRLLAIGEDTRGRVHRFRCWVRMAGRCTTSTWVGRTSDLLWSMTAGSTGTTPSGSPTTSNAPNTSLASVGPSYA